MNTRPTLGEESSILPIRNPDKFVITYKVEELTWFTVRDQISNQIPELFRISNGEMPASKPIQELISKDNFPVKSESFYRINASMYINTNVYPDQLQKEEQALSLCSQLAGVSIPGHKLPEILAGVHTKAIAFLGQDLVGATDLKIQNDPITITPNRAADIENVLGTIWKPGDGGAIWPNQLEAIRRSAAGTVTMHGATYGLRAGNDDQTVFRIDELHQSKNGPRLVVRAEEVLPDERDRMLLKLTMATPSPLTPNSALTSIGIEPDRFYVLRNVSLDPSTTALAFNNVLTESINKSLKNQYEPTQVLTGLQLNHQINQLESVANSLLANRKLAVGTIEVEQREGPDKWPRIRAEALNRQVPEISSGLATTFNNMEPPQAPVLVNSDRVNLDTIEGSRYKMVDWKNRLSDHFQVINNSVDRTSAEQIQRLLNGQQTNVVILNDANTAKLVIQNTPDKAPAIYPMYVQGKVQLPETYLGHTFTTQDKDYLKKFGDMGRPVELIDKISKKPFTGYIGIDQETKRIVVLRQDNFTMPDTIAGKVLTPAQKEILYTGKAVRLDKMEGKNGPFSAYVRISAAKRGFKYDRIFPKAIAAKTVIPDPTPENTKKLRPEVKEPAGKEPSAGIKPTQPIKSHIQPAQPAPASSTGKTKKNSANKVKDKPDIQPTAKVEKKATKVNKLS